MVSFLVCYDIDLILEQFLYWSRQYDLNKKELWHFVFTAQFNVS